MLTFTYVIDGSIYQYELLRCSLHTLCIFNNFSKICIVYYNTNIDNVKNFINDLDFIDTNRIDIHSADISLIESQFPKLPRLTNGRLYYSSLLRWYLPSILYDYDYIWYVDTDILFNASFTERFLELQDKDLLFFGYNRKYYEKTEINKFINVHEVNGGLMLMNLKKFRERNLFDTIIEFYRCRSSHIKYANQDAFQYLFDLYPNECLLEISNECNIKIHDVKYLNDAKILHINGKDKRMLFEAYKHIIENFDI